MLEIQALYKRYAHDVLRFAVHLSGDKSEAEDITAETFTRVLSSQTQIQTETVKSYLLTIARNVYLENLRRKSKFDSIQSDELLSYCPEDNFESQKDVENVLLSLKSLSVDDRTALLLRAEGISYSDISQILDISVTAAKVKIHRLRKRLLIKIQ